MIALPQLPEFASADWYVDPRDHRCPHDAWLDAIEISGPSQGKRNEQRQTAIVVRLLGAYHDGNIIFRYTGVRRYSLVGGACAHGLGDWLDDELTINAEGRFEHRVRWSGSHHEAGAEWSICAEKVSYEWIPKTG